MTATVVGVNAYQTSEEPEIDIFQIDPAERDRQVARLQRVRATRDGGSAAAALANLAQVARSSENTMPAILECVEAYCTTGEICNVFRSVFGVQQDRAAV